MGAATAPPLAGVIPTAIGERGSERTRPPLRGQAQGHRA